MPALQRPAHLAHRAPSAITAALAGGLGVAQPPRISLKDDRFTLLMPNGEHHPQVPPALSINVIVVGGNPNASRIYYDAAYDAADAAAPICWSDNGVGPSVSAGTPQSATCETCPQAVWGSKISPQGSKIPACSTVKKVAVLVAGAGEIVFLLQIPPGSLKPWRAFLAHLDTLGASVDEIIVRLTMNDKTLGFEAVDFMDAPTFEFAQKVTASPEPDAVVGMKDKPREGFALSAPAAQPAAAILFKPSDTWQTSEHVQPTQGLQAPAVPVETDEQRELRELREFKAQQEAAKAAQTPAGFGAAPESAKRTRSPNRAKETVVPPGPIAAGTFAPPQANGFIGGGAPASTPAGFGMAPAQPAGDAIKNAIDRAFNLPT